MRLYAAIDLHSNNSVLVIVDETDKVVHEHRYPNELSVILPALAPHKENIQAIAVESTYNWYWLADGLMAAGYTVKLVNTVAVKIYDGLKHTDDEDDARHLAHLTHFGLPTEFPKYRPAPGLFQYAAKRAPPDENCQLDPQVDQCDNIDPPAPED